MYSVFLSQDRVFQYTRLFSSCDEIFALDLGGALSNVVIIISLVDETRSIFEINLVVANPVLEHPELVLELMLVNSLVI